MTTASTTQPNLAGSPLQVGETLVYQRPGVFVSNIRIVLSGNTHLISRIAAVRVARTNRPNIFRTALILAALFLSPVVVGLNNWWVGIFLALGIWVFLPPRQEAYVLRLTISGVDWDQLGTTSRDSLEPVREAIERAMSLGDSIRDSAVS